MSVDLQRIRAFQFWLWEYTRRNVVYRGKYDLLQTCQKTSPEIEKQAIFIPPMGVVKEEAERREQAFTLHSKLCGDFRKYFGRTPRDYREGASSQDLLQQIARGDRNIYRIDENDFSVPQFGFEVMESNAEDLLVRIPLESDHELVLCALKLRLQWMKEGEGFSNDVIRDAYHELMTLHFTKTARLSRKWEGAVSRAVGLWLWDHAHECGDRPTPCHGTLNKAIEAFFALPHDGKVSLADALSQGEARWDETTLRKNYSQTSRCINMLEILPLRK